tara:strand:+ start:214 stop:840 length:627 start_codon:yes stop_codon:yes gene_type:complete
MTVVKEACVDNIQDAINAFKKGADRIEFCSNLDEDGLTPSNYDLISLKKSISIPVRVMVRPHSNSFNYNDDDLIQMKETIEFCKNQKFDGVVFGCLDDDNELDLNKIKYLADFAKPLNVIIHKAIDLTSSPVNSLMKLLEIDDVNGVLSSGGFETAELGTEVLKKMINISPNEFEIISAGKITNQNFKILHEKIDGKFYHGRKIVGEL